MKMIKRLDLHVDFPPAPQICRAPRKLASSAKHRFNEFNFIAFFKTCVENMKKLRKPRSLALKSLVSKNKRAPDGEWYCCDELLKTIQSVRHYPNENRTLLSMANSLATRSLASALGYSYGEPQPGERYVMLRITRNLGSGRTVRKYFLVDDDQIPQGEGEVMLMGRTTWCRISDDMGDLVSSCGGFGNGVFKVRCDFCNSLYHIRYHVSELACTNTGNGMADSRRSSWI